MALILALDFGGAKLAAALVNVGSRKWLRYERRLSPANANSNTDLEIMRSLINSLLQATKPAAIGVDASTGTVAIPSMRNPEFVNE